MSKKPTILVFIDSIAYFLAGFFPIETATIGQPKLNWVTIPVISILFLIAFIYILSMFPVLQRFYKHIQEHWVRLQISKPKLKNFVNRLKAFLNTKQSKLIISLIPVLLLFLITYTQVFTILLDHVISE